jgi:predicted esterase
MNVREKTMRLFLAVSWLLFCVAACGPAGGGDETADADPDAVEDEGTILDISADDGGAGEDSLPEDTAVDEAPQDEPIEDAADPDEDEVPLPRLVTCRDDPPPGADLPPPLPVYAGECPVLVPGTNTITSSGAQRTFLLAVPSDPDPDEKLPVAFLWHWLGGDASGFFEKGEIETAVGQQRFMAIAPEAKGDLLMKWPFLLIDGAARMEEEARFFDDMLACAAAQFNVNESCISSVGVSAGALWTSQLAQLRAERLSSFLSLSGGVGVPGDYLNPVHAWSGAAHAMPAFVLWGGPTDFCGLSFAVTSAYLEEGLVAGGHFMVECIHNCSHAQPPMEAPEGQSTFASLWRFMLDHPYWLDDGESPYLVTGLSEEYPEWCGIGPGSAVIRTGECDSGPLGDCL